MKKKCFTSLSSILYNCRIIILFSKKYAKIIYFVCKTWALLTGVHFIIISAYI